MILVFGLASIFTVAQAHLCLLSPPQRGNMSGLNTPAAPNCLLLTGPCGGRQAGSPTYYHTGDNMTVIFMKNFDHYYAAAPGEFVVSLGANDHSIPKILAHQLDGGEKAPHIYRLSFPVPQMHIRPDLHYFIQVTYTPNNPNAPKIFYQCADVGFEGHLHQRPSNPVG
ncbi:hypothetical protein FSP39_016942 [Pinctada imbricata]|uniref:Chitin-binding type-4 domain-containing protein n=1 Tax=Pinctada imbricata TaxID=66713 RepID=A0AA88XZK2_PINIB|nr:hypothetical protein FSP39_016942 [Pinctada imbricata]